MSETCTGGLFQRRRHGSGEGGTPCGCWSRAGRPQPPPKSLERDPHTIGRWAAVFGEGGPGALIFEQSGGSPPAALGEAQQGELKGAVRQPPAIVGIELANWYWKGVRQFVSERFGISLCRSSCLNCLHRLGFILKRPRKRLVKADEVKREAFGIRRPVGRGGAHWRQDILR